MKISLKNFHDQNEVFLKKCELGCVYMNYILLSIIAMLLFSVGDLISKIASNQMPSTSVALIRTIVAAIVLGIYTIATIKNSDPISKFSVYAPLAGILIGVGLLSMFKSMETGPLSVIAPIIGISTIITAVLSILVLHEPITLPKIIGIILACVSMILISR